MIGMLPASPRVQFKLSVWLIFPIRALTVQPYNTPPYCQDQATLKTVFFGLVWVLPCEGGSSAGCKHRARRPEEGSDSPPTPTKHWLKFAPLMMSSFVLIRFLDIICGCIPPDANNNQKKSQTDKPPATTIVVKKFVLKLRKIAMKLRKPYRGSHRNSENPREDRIETQKIPLRILLKLRKSSRESGVSHFYLFLGFYEDLFLRF